MSRSNDIRPKKVKKLFKGKYKYEVQVVLSKSKFLSPYEMDDDYLINNHHGLVDYLNEIDTGQVIFEYMTESKGMVRTIHFAEFEDLIIFKLKFDEFIRNIYELIVE